MHFPFENFSSLGLVFAQRYEDMVPLNWNIKKRLDPHLTYDIGYLPERDERNYKKPLNTIMNITC